MKDMTREDFDKRGFQIKDTDSREEISKNHPNLAKEMERSKIKSNVYATFRNGEKLYLFYEYESGHMRKVIGI